MELLKESDCHIITCAQKHTPSKKGMKERGSIETVTSTSLSQHDSY